jgi:hypothetical protein
MPACRYPRCNLSARHRQLCWPTPTCIANACRPPRPAFSRCNASSSVRKEASDVARAKETAQKVRADLEALNAALEKEIEDLDTAFDAQAEKLEEVLVKPKATDIHVRLVGLAWMPYREDPEGRRVPAWSA